MYPSGPRLPKLIQTLGFMFLGVRFLEACRRRYGDVVAFRTLFDSGFVMVFDPELVKQVFQGPHEQLRAGEANVLLGPTLGYRSVLLLDGAEHLRQRRLMLPPFHGRRMRAYEQVMREAADREIDSWPVGEPFALLPSMQSLTLDVIMRAIFGVEEGARMEELKRRVRAMLEPISRPAGVFILSLSAGRFANRGTVQRFEQRRHDLDELIYDEIGRRRDATDLDEREDVFSLLLQARDEEGQPMTDQELRDELVTLLMAGHETTATGLAWTMDLLLHDARAKAELEQSLAAGEGAYLEAVVKESLRLRPVIPAVGRVVRGEPFQLGEYVIPVGVEINPSITVMHRRADLYPNPHEFRPERYLGEDVPDTYTWVPFGGGTRRCLGAAFAQFEMGVVVRRILERTSLEAAATERDPVQRRGITLVPKEGVRVVQRNAPQPSVMRPDDVDAASAAAA